MTISPADALLAGLNPRQREAVESTRGPLCILAGAGTGKTRVISRRVAFAVATGAVKPQNVLVVTFTDKAAAEMRDRLTALGCRGVAASTFHAAALRQLRHFWPLASDGKLPEVLDSKLPVLAPLQRSLPGGYQFVAARDVAQEIEWAKARRIGPREYPFAVEADGHSGPLPADLFAGIFRRYELAKQRAGRIDFEDMLAMTAAILHDHPEAAEQVRDRYGWFSVDEYQDTNALQQELLDRWLGGRDDLAVVGDEDQTIYTFTGASSSYLLGFAARYPSAKTVRIEENYRSTPEVLDLANRLLAAAPLPRVTKRLVATHPSGPEPSLRPFATAEAETSAVVGDVRRLAGTGVPLAEMAVLVRTNAQLPGLEDAFGRAGLQYQVRGEQFFDRYEVRQAVRIARGLQTDRPGDVSLSERLSTAWRRQLGLRQGGEPENEQARQRQAALSTLLATAREVEAGDRSAGVADFLEEVARRAGAEAAGESGGVTLLTYHRAKGLEWDAVFLPALEEGLLPIRQAAEPESIAEERRLFYVGITRARRHLWISWAGRRVGANGKETIRHRSHFLDGLLPRRGASPVTVGTRRRAAEEAGVAGGEVPARPAASRAERSTLSLALRAWRLQRARADGIAAFVVLHDSTLEAIAERAPRTLSELRRVPGIGPAKLDKYGPEILEAVRDTRGEDGAQGSS